MSFLIKITILYTQLWKNKKIWATYFKKHGQPTGLNLRGLSCGMGLFYLWGASILLPSSFIISIAQSHRSLNIYSGNTSCSLQFSVFCMDSMDRARFSVAVKTHWAQQRTGLAASELGCLSSLVGPTPDPSEPPITEISAKPQYSQGWIHPCRWKLHAAGHRAAALEGWITQQHGLPEGYCYLALLMGFQGNLRSVIC